MFQKSFNDSKDCDKKQPIYIKRVSVNITEPVCLYVFSDTCLQQQALRSDL